jgi:hypothetical protein
MNNNQPSIQQVTRWGLMLPPRPPTPSEGSGQAYIRTGNLNQQAIRTFDNGTTLQFGPDVSEQRLIESHSSTKFTQGSGR